MSYFPICQVQETEHLYHILVAHCICTFLDYQQETLLKQCFVYTRSREAMFISKKWKWIQKYHPKKILSKRKRISEFISRRDLLKVGFEFIWLWVAIKPENRQILALFYLINPRRETCLLLKDFLRFGQDSWKASYINRRWNMVSTGL